MTTQEVYDKTRNANLFIVNNANPYLISPYAPNQISNTTGNNILAADIIKSFTTGKTIQVQSPINFQSASIQNVPLSTKRILDSDVKLECSQIGLSQTITASFNSVDHVIMTPTGTQFTDGAGNYIVDVNGQFSQQTTVVGAVGPTAGYVPFLVNGTQYYLQIFT
jgi:hypothetical protein